VQSQNNTVKKQRLIFLHIPKAGGTTLHSVLQHVYQKEETFDINVSGDKLTTDEFTNLSVAEKNKVRLLKGHMYYGLHSQFAEDDAKYLTFLRDPVQRVVSHYHYILRKKDHYLYSEVALKKLSLKEFALSDLTDELDNGQARLLGGIQGLPINSLTSENEKKILKQLEDSFACVGIMEKFDESLLLLKNKLNWERFPVYRKLNVTEEKASRTDEETVLAIQKRNAVDQAIYNWALLRHEADRNAVKDFAEQMRILAEANFAYRDGFAFGERVGYTKGFKKGSEFELDNKLHKKISRKINNLFPGKDKK
jgi:hypothetical protein